MTFRGPNRPAAGCLGQGHEPAWAIVSLAAPSVTEEERAFLQQRVALFWKLAFLITIIYTILEMLLLPERILATSTLVGRVPFLSFGALWLACRRGHRSVRFVLAVEWIGLALASVFFALQGRYLVPDLHALLTRGSGTASPLLEIALDSYVSVATLFGAGLLFIIRAAFVPSPPRWTFALTAILGLPLIVIPHFLAPTSVGVPELRTAAVAPVIGAAAHLITWFVIALSAAAVSRVVYGLRAEMRQARQLGQYTLEGKLGEGGMGVVYRARHGLMRRPTAVKLLKPEQAAETNLKRFEREVQLTARLTHPHTITIFDYGRTPDGVFYYAMELLEGASLDQVVSVSGPLPEARAVHILSRVADALAEAHEIGLIHRDIKPANIMLCRQGGAEDFPKLVDFGLVKDLDQAGASLTQADTLTGTPLFLSPESITAPQAVDPRSDLYSLGAVAYFALTGTTVFEGQTLVEACSHHLHTEPEPPSSRLSRPVDPELESLILDCLAKDPDRRPASAHELARHLERCEAFGDWTREDARAWWRQNGAAVSPEATRVDESHRTFVRQRTESINDSGPERGARVLMHS